MKEEDFLIIEKEFNIKLPEEYKKLVLSNPFKDKKYNKIKDSLFIDINILIQVNKNVLEKNYLSKFWPRNLFIIGAGRENAYSVIDLKNNSFVVYAVMPEDQKPDKSIIKRKQASSYEQFIETEKLFIKM